MKSFKCFVCVFLASLVIASCSAFNTIYPDGTVPITSAVFPDSTFRQYITEAFDKDRNGLLTEDEIYYIRNIHCENMNIRSVKGIEYFPELQGLWCLNNHISSWDLSGNPHLKGIWCSHNDFKSLDFSACLELEWVYCFNCKLTSLNLRNNPELAYLECNANPNLKNLDLSGNPKLENLFCSECGLTSLDLSNNLQLCELAAFKNKLSSVNFSNNTKLKRLDIWYNENLGDVPACQAHVLQRGILVFVCVRDEKIVGAFHVVVEPCVDFYAALRASEFSPPEVIHVQADCRRVDKLQVLSFPSTFFAAQKLVVVEKMKIEVLESASASNCAEIVVDLYIAKSFYSDFFSQ